MGMYNDMDKKFAGLSLGLNSGHYSVESWAAGENIGFGKPIFGYEGDENKAFLFHQDEATIVLSADLVTSNVITLNVNGTEVVVNFDTDHDTTMEAIKTALEGAITGLVVELTDSTGDNRTLELFLKGSDLTVTCVVTEGGSQATATITLDTKQIFLGISLYSAFTSYKDSTGYYPKNVEVNVLTRGKVYVDTSEAVNANTSAYVVESGSNKGKFATAGYTTNCKFRETVAGAGISLIEINGQNNGI